MMAWITATVDKIISLNISAVERWAVTLTVIGGAIIMLWRPWQGLREKRKAREMAIRSEYRAEMKEIKEILHTLKDSNRVLLQAQLEAECMKAIEQGFITVEKHQLITAMFKQYEALGADDSTACIYKTAVRQKVVKGNVTIDSDSC